MAPPAPSRAVASDPLLLTRLVAHELRQTLTVVIGYAGLLAEQDFAEAERAAFQAKLCAAAERLAGSLEKLEHAERRSTRTVGRSGEYQILDLPA